MPLWVAVVAVPILNCDLRTSQECQLHVRWIAETNIEGPLKGDGHARK